MEEALRQRLLTSALKYYQDLIDPTAEGTNLQSSLRATRDRAARTLTELNLAKADRSAPLLSNPSVQRESGLSAEQIAQLVLTASSPRVNQGDSEFFSRPPRSSDNGKAPANPITDCGDTE